MRPSSPGTTAAPSGPPHTHHDLRYHHTPLELEQDEDHHRRQRPKQQSVQPPAATPSGLSMAFCAAYPFQRLAFTSLGKDRIFQLLYFLSGPFLFLMTLAIGAHNAADPKMVATVATTLMMVVWWLFECLPMGITSFLPVVMFPLMGVVPGNRVAMVYFSDQVTCLEADCLIACASMHPCRG